MKRVTSRQRLESCDSFDAPNTVNNSSEEEYDDPKSSEQGICRKRERLHRGQGPAIVPAPILELDSLAHDIHLHIFSFLHVRSLGNVMSVNHKYRQLLLSSEARTLWLEHCRRYWKFPMEADAKIVDSLSIPTVLGTDNNPYSVNLRLLFGMTPPDLPTEINPSYDEGVKMYKDKTTGEPMVKYTGRVGGNRCIRANHPFPKPRPHMTHMEESSLSDVSELDLDAVAKDEGPQYRPFCAPYMDRDGSIQVTPRLVTYFETSILQIEEGEAQVNELPPLRTFPFARRAECTAIGIATSAFNLHSRMPGWDYHSYGYHGDDGKIFHSSGWRLAPFGPTFGAGDTVGCGIDYVAQGIFYTLNGNFLGYAWKGLHRDVLLNNDWYPVVGIDTNAPISVNFGRKPFQYDLKKFNLQHEMLISPCYQHDTKATTRSLPPEIFL